MVLSKQERASCRDRMTLQAILLCLISSSYWLYAAAAGTCFFPLAGPYLEPGSCYLVLAFLAGKHASLAQVDLSSQP